MRVTHPTPDTRRLAGVIAFVLALGVSVTTCRLDKLINPATADRLVVAPDSVGTSANFGSTSPDTIIIQVGSADGAVLPWTATKSAAWIALLNSSGTTPDTARVVINPDTLSETPHQDTIVFVSAPTNDTIKVPLVLTMLPAVAELSVTPASRADTAFLGSAQPDTFTLMVRNTGALALTWSATLDTGWITLSDSGATLVGQDSTPVIVSLAPESLAVGTHNGSITVTAPSATRSPRTVPVTYTIRPCVETAITLDTVVTGAIALSDCGAPQRAGRQAKIYSVQATAGDTLSFRLTAAFNAYLILTNSTGVAVLDENDQCAPANTACLLNFIVSTTGRYLVEVTTINAGETGAFTLSAVKELSPSQPAAGQFRANGTTAIAVGAVTPENTVVFKATLNDPNPRDSVRLEVEAEGLVTGPQTHVSPFVLRGTPVSLPVTPLNENEGYHWRARTCDQTTRCSAWFSFGGNVDPAADFFINAVQEDPVLPADADQFQAGGVTVIPVGGNANGSPATIVFKGLVTDPDPGDLISLEVEFKTTDVSFNGVGTPGPGVTTGNNAQLTASPARGLLGLNYYWRARACDQTNRCSAWFSFGANSDVSGGALNPAATDFRAP